MTTASFYDGPITAIECTAEGAVYFTTGNLVYRCDSNAVKPASATRASSSITATAPVRCATAPPGTVLSSLAIVPEAPGRHSAIALMGAADHLLAHFDRAPTHDAAKETFTSCACLLRTAESRILRIAVDAARDNILVLTAANDFVCVSLRDVVQQLLLVAPGETNGPATATSGFCASPPGLYAGLLSPSSYRRLRGPPLGVVLAADILVLGGGKTSDDSDASLARYRFFAATYAGGVVEWQAVAREGTETAASKSSVPSRCRVVSRVQAHPSGCAIFSVRVTQSSPNNDGEKPNSPMRTSDMHTQQRTHLVTCSDDRTVALYERSRTVGRPDSEKTKLSVDGAWQLLWRGEGLPFARSRVFDVTMRAVWTSPQNTNPHTSAVPPEASSCAVHVGVAGEDGCVQAFRIARNAPERRGERAERATASTSNGAVGGVVATPCFVRARQHRGHGAYRVAFVGGGGGGGDGSAAAGDAMTLLSGGFDGTVLVHRYLSPQKANAVSLGAGHCSLSLNASSIVDESAASPSAASSPSPAPTKKVAQVRVVHVDVAGHLLACTSQTLCVRYNNERMAASWSTSLPLTPGEADGRTAAALASFGLPTAAESFVVPAPFFSERCDKAHKAAISLSCLTLGTDAGVLYTLPYACTSVDGHAASPTTLLGTSPLLDGNDAVTVNAALHVYNKITQVAVLEANTHECERSTDDDHRTWRYTYLVATSHVRHTVALSALHVVCTHASGKKCRSAPADAEGGLRFHTTWQTLAVFTGGAGPLTTVLTLVPLPGTARHAKDAVLCFWLLVGDKNGCLTGVHQTYRATFPPASIDAECHTGAADGKPVSLTGIADVHQFIFAEHLHIAISAVCAETCLEGNVARQGGTEDHGAPMILTIAGTGGVVEFLCLPSVAPRKEEHAVLDREPSLHEHHAAPRPAMSREPLRLPFEVSAVLAVGPRACVVQSGTTVSVLYRRPAETSWVLADSVGGIRAPRLLTARIVTAPAKQKHTRTEGMLSESTAHDGDSTTCVFVAHCSNGHTVEEFATYPDASMSTSPRPRTSLLSGHGFPGKDYNCVAYAPAPLDCLLLGNEDSSLVVLPLQGASNASTRRGAVLPHHCTAPLSVCGAHHSNILAISILPRNASAESARSPAGVCQFASVGGGAMVSLWASDATSPLRLVDWWCGAASPPSTTHTVDASALPSSRSADREEAEASSAPLREQHVGTARFQKKRAAKHTHPTGASWSVGALAERMPRFLSVTAWDMRHLAVGSSDGTVLIFSLQETEPTHRGMGTEAEVASTMKMQLAWQGQLHMERPKPIMCVRAVNAASAASENENNNSTEAKRLLVAGDTNGMVYAVDVASHAVLGKVRLEQSCLNALSEVHRVPGRASVSTGAETLDGKTWRFAAIHDSGVEHLVQLTLSTTTSTFPSTAAPMVTFAILCSVSTGVTAGRGVHWPMPSQPLVAVAEERLLAFDASALQRGELRVSREQRVNVRCVSGAALVSSSESTAPTDNVAIAVVGQGVEVL